MPQQHLDHDEVRLVMDAPPETVYDLVADVTRMHEFSPEIEKCTWRKGATGPAVGAKFRAKNKFAKGPPTLNFPVMTVVEPGRKVPWSRSEPFGGVVEWTYEFLPHGDGTEVVESYHFHKPVSRFGWVIISTFDPGDRKAKMRAGMEQTLERLRDAVEGRSAS